MERLTKVMDKYLSEAKKKVLTLAVSKEWFDMIVSGEKNEEYREIKPYWASRLVNQQAESGEVLFESPSQFVSYLCGSRIEKEIENIFIGKPKKGLCPGKWLDHEFFIIKFK